MPTENRPEPRRNRPRLQLQRLWVPLFMMVGISILSGTAGVQMGSWSFVGIDKLGHLVVFGLLGISWARVPETGHGSRMGILAAAVLLTTGFGLVDELHRYQNPLRYFEWADLAADFAGALVAAALYLGNPRLRGLLERKIGHALRLPSGNKRANLAADGGR